MAGQLTLAMLKPHAVLERNVGKILTRIEETGFAIVLAKMVQLRKEGALQFYEEHKDKDFYGNLCNVMCSGPIWVLVLAKPNAVEEWRNFIGATNPAEAKPETLRYEFGDHGNITNNAVHGSATDADAKREITFFFAREIKIAERLEEIDNQEVL
jgi:nucleoside-diphosphate kinase